MAYGIENEAPAVQMFQDQFIREGKTVQIRECGLYVSVENGVLAASPDRVGKVNDEDVVIEVKCLSASRDLSPLEATQLKQRDGNFPFREIDGCMVLKTRHRYHFQIQMQMAITGVQKCYLVVFTSRSVPVAIVTVHFDSDFWEEMKEKLLEFHNRHVIPALVFQRFGKAGN